MKAIRVLLTILAGTIAAAAAPTASPVQDDHIESVIVTAPALRSERVLNSFIISHTAPSPLLGKITRWKTGICPVTIGLPGKFDTFVTQRIIRVAMMAGAPLDKSEPCHPNLVVLATDQPQALLDMIRARHSSLLGFHYRSRAQELATMRLPIQAWYSTVTEDVWGMIQADTEGLDVSKAMPGAFGIAGGVHASGSRAIGDGLRSEIAIAIIVVDAHKIAGRQIGALADYIAMLSLSQGRSYDACQEVPTITNLMAQGCGADSTPDGLTDIDLTYLRGLYKMDAGRSFLGERASIAYEMKKELGGY